MVNIDCEEDIDAVLSIIEELGDDDKENSEPEINLSVSQS
jgi:hypothetical protein